MSKFLSLSIWDQYYKMMGEFNEDITLRIQVEWLKWRKALGVICHCKVPTKVNGKLYHTTCPTILYGIQGRGSRNENVKMDAQERIGSKMTVYEVILV